MGGIPPAVHRRHERRRRDADEAHLKRRCGPSEGRHGRLVQRAWHSHVPLEIEYPVTAIFAHKHKVAVCRLCCYCVVCRVSPENGITRLTRDTHTRRPRGAFPHETLLSKL